jgi:hypothetical protein
MIVPSTRRSYWFQIPTLEGAIAQIIIDRFFGQIFEINTKRLKDFLNFRVKKDFCFDVVSSLTLR